MRTARGKGEGQETGSQAVMVIRKVMTEMG